MDDVIEQTLHLEREGHSVPVVLWRAARPASAPSPLVLLGHGGSGHKRSARVVDHARWFVEQTGISAAAIDGPYHGERVSRPLSAAEYSTLIAAEGAETVALRMTEDWLTAIAAINELAVADTLTLGYLGLSMGTRYGLPLAAALGERLACAVFGKFGLQHGPAVPAGLRTTLSEQAASQVSARTLWHVQWDDELFPRAGQLQLFDALAASDKRLLAFPGRHADTHTEAIATWRRFLAGALIQHRQSH